MYPEITDATMLAHPASRLVSTAVTDDQVWFALYTRAHWERRIIRSLRVIDVACFFPVVPRRRRWHDRRKLVSWPLFPGYVFVRVDAERLFELTRIEGVADVVRFGERPAPIDEEEIENVRRFVRAQSDAGAELVRVAWNEGPRVRIESGPWAGLEGVARDEDGTRVIIGISTIGAGFEVDASGRSLAVP